MELTLIRDLFTEDSSLGKIYVNDEFLVYSLEDKYREVTDVPVSQWKVPGESAIPLGRYKLVIRFSERFQFATPHIEGVEGFTAIEIHPGNTHLDTEGCVLVGTQRNNVAVLNSRIAFGILMGRLATVEEDMWITIA